MLLPIHGVDRGCLGNHNMIAKVVSVENKFCKLGTAEGIIDTKFLMDQLQLVKDGSRIQAFDVPTNRTVSFTAAHKKAGGYKRKKKGDAEAQEEEVEEHEDGKKKKRGRPPKNVVSVVAAIKCGCTRGCNRRCACRLADTGGCSTSCHNGTAEGALACCYKTVVE